MDKTQINMRVQARYNFLMEQGKHGHYETMFKCVHEELKAQADANSQAVQDLVAALRDAYEVMESYCGEYGMGALEEASDKVENVLAKYGSAK